MLNLSEYKCVCVSVCVFSIVYKQQKQIQSELLLQYCLILNNNKKPAPAKKK